MEMLVRRMVWLSLCLNIAVLVPVCAGLLLSAAWANWSYGEATAARGILLSMYLAIGVTSALLLLRPDPMLVAPLLLVQVIYKLTTPLTVGTLANPVVLSNLLIAAVHAVTLTLIVRHHRTAGLLEAPR
jgi:hypothetical protein